MYRSVKVSTCRNQEKVADKHYVFRLLNAPKEWNSGGWGAVKLLLRTKSSKQINQHSITEIHNFDSF
jgi:hypothetical protein